MRTIITEFKRMFFEKKIIWLLIVTVIYVVVCSMFWELRFKLDYNYVEVHYKASAFKIWQDTMCKSFVTVLMNIVPTMIYLFSFMDDRKNGIDNQICIKTYSNNYYIAKYITVITGGMLYNLLSVILIYFPIYFLFSRGNDGWNYLDRTDALIGKYFTGNTAIEFVLLVALSYAFVGGVCAAMSYVISMWTDNRVLVCIMPYIIFRMLRDLWCGEKITALTNIILGGVDVFMTDQPFIYSVYHFIWWVLLLSILLIISYTIKVEQKR